MIILGEKLTLSELRKRLGKLSLYDISTWVKSRNPEIRLDLGQPDVPVDERIIEAAVNSLRRGETGYTATAGINELREIIAEREGVDPDEVVVGAGGKIMLSAAIMRASLVGLISPHWTAYERTASSFDTPVKFFKTSIEDGWIPHLQELGVDLLILNYPNNPTGRIIPKESIREILELAEDEDVKVISDEVYAEISWRDFTPLREMSENVITVKSFSKLFSMTGFRLGYAIGPKKDIRELQKFMEATITCVPIFVQRAGIRAMELWDEIRARISEVYRKRGELAYKILSKKFQLTPPDGAFYIFVDTGVDSTLFVDKMVDEGISMFPGDVFGGYDTFVRISLVSDRLEYALGKMVKVKEELEDS